MSKIHKLSPQLVDLIAAGEVVERPASVLKELVENALDAGASRIAIELEGAGKRLIAVSDDGEGMLPDDALLALERHATSKIREPRDLEGITTLGFRGEALPAIASVSRFELTTAAEGPSGGVRVRVENGGPPRAEATARGRGTTVVVRDLFYGTPARRKFLKSDATELRRLLDVVVEEALARPAISFAVRSGGRDVLRLPSCGTLADRVAAIYGSDYAGSLVTLDAALEQPRLTGLLQRPEDAGSGRRRQMLFVNGRPVQDRALTQAAFRGYASTLASGVFPHFFLFLSIDPNAVDVNVHPAKREVRFRDPDALFGFVQSAVRGALGGLRPAGDLRRGRGFRRVAGPMTAGAGEARRAPAEMEAGRTAREHGGGYRVPGRDQLALFLNARLLAEPDLEIAPAGEPRPARLWQLHDAFVLAQTRTGVAIIDQHSAHERVLYEALLAAFEREIPAAQELVFPRTYELSPPEWQAWRENQGLFERLGFRLEPFGERTLALRALPQLGHRFGPEEAFAELLADLAESRVPAASQHERLARALACRGAIKAGQPLGQDEMARLFSDLFATRHPTADVHGRPAVIQVRLDELARRFERA